MSGSKYYAIVDIKGRIYAIELMSERRDSDVWTDLDAFDAREGTDLYDRIDTRNILEVVDDLDRAGYRTCIIRNASDVEGLFGE